MYCTKKVTGDLFWVGGNDRRTELFENVYPIPEGVSYNSYVLMDEKHVLLDTVDDTVSGLFLENVAHVLNGGRLDYIVVNHMEPDHSATLNTIVQKYPEATIVCNAKILGMIRQFFDVDAENRVQIVNEGDTLTTGKHTLTFVNAPMVHWPEVMMTFDTTDGILFAADAFGTFGALSGSLFADEYDFERDWLDSARRYYCNIVGKYGPQVTKVLQKASGLDIKMICPLHGPVWRENIGWFIDKYLKWSSYTPEESAVLVVYGSIYGHTQNAAEIAASKLSDEGVKNIVVYDVSKTDVSYLVGEAFRCSHLILASATYNNEIFSRMEQFLLELKEHNFQNRTAALIENGSWAPQAGKKMKAMLEDMKNMTVLEETVTVKSALKADQEEDLSALARLVAESINA